MHAAETSTRLGPNGFAFKAPVQLTYWKSLEGPRHDAQVKITDDFNASRSDVKVTLEHVGVYATNTFAFADELSAERVSAALVSASLFDVFQVHPFLGRLIRDEDAQPAPSRAVLLGYDFWQGRFGGDRDVVGRTVEIEAVPREIWDDPALDIYDRD